VVDAQSADEPVVDEPQHDGVRRREHLRILDPDACQVVDVEEATVEARRPVDVEEPPPQLRVAPERVLVLARGHVVRDDVENHLEPRLAERAESGLAAELVRDAARIGDVIAVLRAVPRLQHG
jgi:hypothetical protein